MHRVHAAFFLFSKSKSCTRCNEGRSAPGLNVCPDNPVTEVLITYFEDSSAMKA